MVDPGVAFRSTGLERRQPTAAEGELCLTSAQRHRRVERLDQGSADALPVLNLQTPEGPYLLTQLRKFKAGVRSYNPNDVAGQTMS